ncbi:MAG: response regulator [Desulfomonile tiedjei]|nr:response regulator [Desulfomonile tiedjei]
MVISDNARPTVLIIDDKERGARFLEGVLRNGFQVRIVTTCQAAVDFLKTDSPDLVLCDHVCLHAGKGELLDALTNGSEVLEIPLIVVAAERPEEDAELMKLLVGAVDCVPRSVPPRLLRWKVRNWIHLKREIDRLRYQSRGEEKPAAALSRVSRGRHG